MHPPGITNLGATRQLTAQYCFEHLRIDTAFQPECFSARANPFTRALGIGLGIIIVRGKIAGSTACRMDIGNRQHKEAPGITYDADPDDRVSISLGMTWSYCSKSSSSGPLGRGADFRSRALLRRLIVSGECDF